MIRKKYTLLRRFSFCAAAVVLAAMLLTAMLLTGCGTGKAGPGAGTGAGTGTGEENRLQVVTTIFPQYDFARQIAGDRADVTMLLKPGEEVHSYEPTPQDIKRIQNCDLFIYTGGENDVWVDSILESAGEQGPEAVRLLDLAETYAEESLEGMMPEKGSHEHEEEDPSGDTGAQDHEDGEEEVHDHEEESHDHEEENHGLPSGESVGTVAHGHMHGEEPDEHIWTSPENCVILIEKLTDIFCKADPANEAVYRANGDEYRAAFEELDEEYRSMMEAASRKTILFGDRFPFRYLAEELGLTCYAAFSGCSSESEPSAATIAFLIDKTAQERLPVVFKIEFSNGNIAEAVREAAQLRVNKEISGSAGGSSGQNTAAGTGGEGGEMQMQVLQLHSCHNLTRDEFTAGETCLSLMRRNLESLRTALGA